MSIIDYGEDEARDPALWLLHGLRAGPRWRFLAAGAAAFGTILVLILLALARFGRGPLAPTAPETWVYVATARGSVHGPALQIEAVDVATGERRTFQVGAPVLDLALSRDRRRLFVASDEGRVLVLDALRGAIERVVHLPSVFNVEYVVPIDDSRLLAVVNSPPGSALLVLDLDRDGDGTPLDLNRRVAGRPVFGRETRVPVVAIDALSGARRTNGVSVITVSLEPLMITHETGILAKHAAPLASIGSSRAPPVITTSGDVAVAFDPTTAVLAWLAPDATTVTDLAEIYAGSRPDHVFLTDASGDAILVADAHVVHVCVGRDEDPAAPRAVRQRYVVSVETHAPVVAGDDCGSFTLVADSSLALATENRLHILDPRTGRRLRSFALSGYAVVARGR